MKANWKAGSGVGVWATKSSRRSCCCCMSSGAAIGAGGTASASLGLLQENSRNLNCGRGGPPYPGLYLDESPGLADLRGALLLQELLPGSYTNTSSRGSLSVNPVLLETVDHPPIT